MVSTPVAVFAGVDTGTDSLDVSAGDESWKVDHTPEGLKRLARWLSKRGVTHVVVEATGRYHELVHEDLTLAGFAVCVVNPKNARRFAQSRGQAAKTDKADAKMLREYGEKTDLVVTPLASEGVRKVRRLCRRREQLLRSRSAESNRLECERDEEIRIMLHQSISDLQIDIEHLDARIKDEVQKCPELCGLFRALTSQNGIGDVIGVSLAAGVPELGRISNRKLTSLLGLAPMNNDSGRRQGKRRLTKGKPEMKSKLYMGALTAANSHPKLMVFYQSLLNSGKTKMVAMVAVARKLLVLANAIARDYYAGISPEQRAAIKEGKTKVPVAATQ